MQSLCTNIYRYKPKLLKFINSKAFFIKRDRSSNCIFKQRLTDSYLFRNINALTNTLNTRPLAKTLLDKQDPDDNQRTVFHLAVLYSFSDGLEFLLTQLDSSEVLLIPDLNKATAIDYAVKALNEDILIIIIKHDLAKLLFTQNNLGIVPFASILQSGNQSLLKKLLSTLPRNRSTLLHTAIETENIQIVYQLVDFIVNNSLSWLFEQQDNLSGLTPLDLAQQLGNTRIISILENARHVSSSTNFRVLPSQSQNNSGLQYSHLSQFNQTDNALTGHLGALEQQLLHFDNDNQKNDNFSILLEQQPNSLLIDELSFYNYIN